MMLVWGQITLKATNEDPLEAESDEISVSDATRFLASEVDACQARLFAVVPREVYRVTQSH